MKIRLSALAAIAAAGALAAGCGSSDTNDSAAGNAADATFVADMTVHHQGAIDMAKIAQTRAEHPEIKRLADDIVSSQQAEIATMKRIAGDLPDAASSSDGGHAGMSDSEMSAGMDKGTDMSALETAKPFDRAFIAAMIPHHQSAITMAQKLLDEGKNAELRGVAEAIIAAQTREIGQMKAWQKAWYGTASTTAGG